MTTATTVVDVHGLEKTYGKANERQYKALKDINFSVAAGEFVGIMGASGSGKTTLLNMLSTLDTPTKGDVIVNGHDVTKMRGNQLADFRAQEVGFIFQDFNLLESLTAEENIGLPLALKGTASKLWTKRFMKWRKRCRLLTYSKNTRPNFPVGRSNGSQRRGPSSITHRS